MVERKVASKGDVVAAVRGGTFQKHPLDPVLVP